MEIGETKNISSSLWKSSQILDWLESLNLVCYFDALVKAEIDGSKLITLKRKALSTDLNITDHEHQSIIVKSLKELKNEEKVAKKGMAEETKQSKLEARDKYLEEKNEEKQLRYEEKQIKKEEKLMKKKAKPETKKQRKARMAEERIQWEKEWEARQLESKRQAQEEKEKKAKRREEEKFDPTVLRRKAAKYEVLWEGTYPVI